MTFDAGIQEVLQIGTLLATPALATTAFFLKRLVDTVARVELRIAGVEKELRTLNGRLTKIETWRDLFQAQEAERHRAINEHLRDLRSDQRDRERDREGEGTR